MWRKRRSPAPGFKQPQPFDPISGQHANMGPPGIFTRLSVFQVTDEDTHDNYVVCRGWDLDTDPDCQYLYDASLGGPAKGINVAKPYGLRGMNPYKIGQMVIVAKVRTRLGDNCGVAAVTTGQPADLDEVVDILTDDDDNPIAWVIIEDSGGGLTPRILYDDAAPGGTDIEAWPVFDDNGLAADTGADKVLIQNVFPGTFRGYGSSHSGFDETTAAKVWTARGPDGKEHIVSGDGLASMCLCQLTAAQVGSDANFSVDNVTPVGSGQSPVIATSDTLTAYNVSASAGADNAVACIEFNETSGHWEVQWIINTSQDVFTNWQYNASNTHIEKKTRTLWGNWGGAESGWTEVDTTTACT
jgi:hypothetical protein